MNLPGISMTSRIRIGVVAIGLTLLGACAEEESVNQGDGAGVNRSALGTAPAGASGRYIVKYRDASPGASAVAAAGGRVVLDLPGHGAAAVELNEQGVGALRASPAIEYVEEDPVRFPMGDGAAETVPYGIGLTQADLVPDAAGGNVTLCIIDSAVSSTHADLPAVASRDNDGIDGCGHGSHVAGIATAVGGNGIGVVGVNAGGTLAVKSIAVFSGADCAWTYASGLVAALDACRQGVSGKLVVSMSLGGDIKSRFEDTAFASAESAGVLSIAAAGNAGNTRVSYPAGYASVMSVGALDANKNVATFSQKNADVEISAPGVAVDSTVPWLETATATASNELGATTVAGHSVERAARGTATGSLVDGGLCDSAGAWAGQIVLCERGSISFLDKVTNAQTGGAAGVIIYNNVEGGLLATLDPGSSEIPAIGITMADGLTLLDHVGETTTLVSTREEPASGYEAWDGTSMATPYVSGIAAKIWRHQDTRTNKQVRWALASSALELGTAGRDTSYGWGLVQAQGALTRLQGPVCKASGQSCQVGSECCSMTCAGKGTKFTCK